MRFLLGLLMLVISGSALATIDVMQFKDEAQEQQFRQLTEQLRCPKCQNNSIADSNSMIATDLRQKVYELMQEGKSQKEIVDYMVARYGNFVTYDPPLTPLTVLLWVMPVVAIGLGGWIIFARTRRRVRVKQEEFPDDVIPNGKRGGFGLFVPGIVVALVVGAVSYYQTGSYKQVQVWQQATAQAPALLERALIRKRNRSMKKIWRVWRWGCVRVYKPIPQMLKAGSCLDALAWFSVTPVRPLKPMPMPIDWILKTAMRRWAMRRR